MPRVTKSDKAMSKEERAAAREARSKARGEARSKAQAAKKASPKPTAAPNKEVQLKPEGGKPTSQLSKKADERRAARQKTDARPEAKAARQKAGPGPASRMKPYGGVAQPTPKAAPAAKPNVQPYYDPSKATKAGSGVMKGIARVASKVAGPVGVAVTGYEVGKAMTGRSGIAPMGGQMSRGKRSSMATKAKSMAQSSYDATKGRSKAAIEAGKKDALSQAKVGGSPKVTKPAAKGNAASAPKAQSERPAQKKAQPKGGQSHSTTMTDTAGKSKKMKRNAGYDNYLDIMSSEGLAEGGKVKGYAGGGYQLDVSPMGMVKNAVRAVNQIKKGMQNNAPKASSSNQGPVERKSPRKDGNSGRELVPESLMDDVRTSRGYADGGAVKGNSDIYGSYGGSGGVAKHMVKVEKTNIKRNGS